MMEYLFRGKREVNGDWVEGSLVVLQSDFDVPARYEIHNTKGAIWLVDPATVGQFTGLLDKNGTRIFEGDKLFSSKVFEVCTERDDEHFAVVTWDDKKACYYGDFRTTCYEITASNFCSYEVIGNIHDNPELLEAKQ